MNNLPLTFPRSRQRPIPAVSGCDASTARVLPPPKRGRLPGAALLPGWVSEALGQLLRLTSCRAGEVSEQHEGRCQGSGGGTGWCHRAVSHCHLCPSPAGGDLPPCPHPEGEVFRAQLVSIKSQDPQNPPASHGAEARRVGLSVTPRRRRHRDSGAVAALPGHGARRSGRICSVSSRRRCHGPGERGRAR